MNPFEMVVIIVAIVTIGRVISARYGVNAWGKRGRRGQDDAAQVDAAAAADTLRLKSEVTRLNERIQVLERLATDPSKRLSDQIDALGPKT